MELDIRTILVGYVITDLVSTLVMVALWRQSRRRFAGAVYWVFDFALQTLALIMIAARGTIPDILSIAIANLMAMGGVLLGLLAVRSFLGKKFHLGINLFGLAVFFAIHCWFTFVQPNLAVRDLNLSITMVIYMTQCAWALLRPGSDDLGGGTRGVGLVFVAYVVTNVLRIAEFFWHGPRETNYLHSGLFNALVMLAYQMLFILLTYSLTLMFNRRLAAEVTFEEEKFSKAFHSAPYAVILSRMSDGKLLEVNRGFTRISGYAHEEAVGQTVFALRLWEHAGDRTAIVEELMRTGRVLGRVSRFRRKSGELLTASYSAERISVGGEDCLLSSIEDITGRIANEEHLRETTLYLENLLNHANAPIVVWDAGRRITTFNHAFERLTGRTFAEVVGQHLDFLFPEASREASLAYIHETASGGRWEAVELEIQGTNGSVSTVLWNSANIYGKNQELVATIAQGQDITRRIQAEQRVRDLLAEKDLILREAHHRIKNNMMTVQGLLQIQAEGQDNAAARGVILGAAGRVMAMMVLYDKLYRSDMVGTMPARDYMVTLIREIADIFTRTPAVVVTARVDDIQLDSSLLSQLGIIINELVTNAMKYAFVEGQGGTVTVTLRRQDGGIILSVADNGRGLPAGFTLEGQTGFGLLLARTIVRQLGGHLTLASGEGTCFTLDFPAASLRLS